MDPENILQKKIGARLIMETLRKTEAQTEVIQILNKIIISILNNRFNAPPETTAEEIIQLMKNRQVYDIFNIDVELHIIEIITNIINTVYPK